ncbi:MAG: 50S ribosomal protein L4 [Candidatus Omnitrophota bacterium]|jgi:large subunit ribosomal protein L4|nr:MAG: 50S ribosomal protein L4 [Candidatus Omnitrophota bacterium]
MENLTISVFNMDGKEVESLKLDASVFDGSVNKNLLHRVLTVYRSNQRKGLAATKTRGEVSGGGIKPWRQKGTGRARVGSIRSPLWRHGGVVFGPHPRSFFISIPKKLKTLALKSALNAKLNEGNLMVLDRFEVSSPKTKEVEKIFKNLKLIGKDGPKNKRLLLLSDKLSANAVLATRNLKFLDTASAKDANSLELMLARRVLITKDSIKQLVQRIKK